MQLTNIIRDVGDDARRGRIYLPVDGAAAVRRQGARDPAAPAPWGYSERFTALMRFQAERAHRCYDEALALLPRADRASQKPGLMMANIYRTLLREIEADGFQVLHQRTSLTSLRKLWIAVTHATGAAAEVSAARRRVAVVGAGWAGLAAAVQATPTATRSRCSRWPAHGGGRARSVPSATRWPSTTASTS